MKPIDLVQVSNKISQFMTERNWDQFHSVKNLTMALSVECSELVELYQWLSEDESNKINSNEKLLKRTEEEVADLAIYLIRILEKTNIDLQQVIEKKMEQNALKYPIHLSKGKSDKYTDFK